MEMRRPRGAVEKQMTEELEVSCLRSYGVGGSWMDVTVEANANNAPLNNLNLFQDELLRMSDALS
jgi:hypothetical protein